MSEILNLRNAIVTTLQGETSVEPPMGRLAGVHVYAHDGEFDSLRELKRQDFTAPAVFISILSALGTTQGGEPAACVSLGAFIITKDIKIRGGEPIRENGRRGDQAVAIADALLDYVLRFPTPSWGVEAGKPEHLSASNLYDDKFDAENIAVWAVFWEQTVTLKTTPGVTLEPFAGFHVDFDIAPREDGAELGDELEAEADVTF